MRQQRGSAPGGAGGSDERNESGGWRGTVGSRLGGAFASSPRLRLRSAMRRTPQLRRRLLLALAVAEEDLMRRHAEAAAAFVGATAGELPFDRALAVYLRLVDVPRRDRRPVAARVLAGLEGTLPPEALAGEDADGVLHRVLHRLGGRRRPELRAHIGAAAQRARHVIYSAHLRGAERVASVLDGAVGRPEAVQYYLDAMDVAPGWAERIFHAALDPGEAAA